ncbi:MAG: hypothetical protein HC897_17230 [Thermoanaerobaculia bacterium]|nr:hypothetical protein [Thermoanaerobaculia bacterium]
MQIGPGTLAVEVSSADNGNGWAEIKLRGSVGTLSNGKVNRDGIGAVAYFTPEDGKTAIRPIIGGSSYASQDSLAANFGMGAATSGTVEILWPGGVRNRLVDVEPGEKILFPEIPCDFASQGEDRAGYTQCVTSSLDELVAAGVIGQQERARFIKGAFACQPSDTTLCLAGGRFQAEVAWKNFAGETGMGHVFTSGDQHGSFYFFNSEVLEFHVNLIDACELRNRFWVFAAASTNVEYTLTVTDIETQTVKSYTNQLGKAAPAITDTEAFATCP